MTKSTKPNTLFWVISSIALIWNMMGAFSYLAQAYITDEAKAALPEPEQLYLEQVPSWVTATYATAVFAGLLGCIALLLRKKIATSLFVLSFIAVIAQAVYNLFLQEFMTPEIIQMIMTLLIIGTALFLIWYSKLTLKKGWIS